MLQCKFPCKGIAAIADESLCCSRSIFFTSLLTVIFFLFLACPSNKQHNTLVAVQDLGEF